MRNVSTILRWLAVFPAAILAGWLAHYVSGLASVAVASVTSASISYYLRLLIYYSLKNAFFVLAGSLVSPRPLPIAIVLAVLSIALSLITHILTQQRVGTTNYVHFALETAGALMGVVIIYCGARLRSAKSSA